MHGTARTSVGLSVGPPLVGLLEFVGEILKDGEFDIVGILDVLGKLDFEGAVLSEGWALAEGDADNDG